MTLPERDVALERLRDVRRFIEYARYELEPTLVSGAQFPSQECADKRLRIIDDVIMRLLSPTFYAEPAGAAPQAQAKGPEAWFRAVVKTMREANPREPTNAEYMLAYWQANADTLEDCINSVNWDVLRPVQTCSHCGESLTLAAPSTGGAAGLREGLQHQILAAEAMLQMSTLTSLEKEFFRCKAAGIKQAQASLDWKPTALVSPADGGTGGAR